MPTLAPDSAEAKAIDASLSQWRQGDLALEERWFIHVGDASQPLTVAASEAAGTGLQALTTEVAGLAVVSQTCDVIRRCVERPYIEIAPLVRVDAKDLVSIQRGYRPALATLPVLLAEACAVDLDRVMTVEKSIVAGWMRTSGCASDRESRAFARALARKCVRFAFPDDFTEFADKLHQRLSDKHERMTRGTPSATYEKFASRRVRLGMRNRPPSSFGLSGMIRAQRPKERTGRTCSPHG